MRSLLVRMGLDPISLAVCPWGVDPDKVFEVCMPVAQGKSWCFVKEKNCKGCLLCYFVS